MRIAIYHSLPSGGAKRALYEWMRRLVGSHSMDVFTLTTADHSFCDIRPFAQEYRVYDFVPNRLFESPLGRLNRLQRWRDLGELMKLGRQIAHTINTGGYDLTFAHPCPYTFIPPMLQFVRIPSVYYLHEPFGPAFQRIFERPYLKPETRWRVVSKRLDPFYAIYHRRLEAARIASIRWTTRLLANSQFTRRHMKLGYDVEAPVCYYGVNTEDFHPRPDTPQGDWVLSVGELTPRKGFDFLIESLAHIPDERRPALRLVSNWVSPEERKYVEELAIRRGVELHIRIGLDTGQLALEYDKAALCVYAPMSEALGLVPLESMACGTPVVGVGEGGVLETVRHQETGILTDRSPQHFAQAVQDLLSDPVRRMKLGQRGREYVKDNWQWTHSVRDLEEHLSSAVLQPVARNS